jgi:multisubunit Na+/H+ antiporter MnhG subunit
MEILSSIADVCGILGFIISLFAIGGVIRINKKIDSNKVNLKKTKISGGFTGRDSNN